MFASVRFLLAEASDAAAFSYVSANCLCAFIKAFSNFSFALASAIDDFATLFPAEIALETPENASLAVIAA
jgi:hypothetical protein